MEMHDLYKSYSASRSPANEIRSKLVSMNFELVFNDEMLTLSAAVAAAAAISF